MKDLTGLDLKESLKKNIFYALKHRKNDSLKIIFFFSGLHQGNRFCSREHITYFAGFFKFKDVDFDTRLFDEESIINILVSNFYYDKFTYIDCVEDFGEIQCHGHGDYWGEDTFVFTYQRFNCVK